MLLLGHRGCRGEVTENTIAAFDYALESGCDGFELDVRLTGDGIPVIWHDARLRGRFLSRQRWEPMRELCLKAGRLPRREAIELCQLEEVLARYRHVAWMDIELKVRGVEAQVAELVRRLRPERGFVLSSFRRPVLLELHRIDPTLPLGFIFDRMPQARVWNDLPVQYVKPSARLVTAALVEGFHAQGMKVLTWTVNSAVDMRRLAEAGVDGMIGDDPVALAASRRDL
jgi:glycerophosphoryl diester phosphodiesterase